MRYAYLYTTMVFLLVTLNLSAQDPIGTETVTVVKAYTPTVSDANKIKPEPEMNDSIILRKQDLEYQIYSVPVASTFTPAKGKAAQPDKEARESLFNSYFTAGLGNYNNALLNFYSSNEMDRGNKRFDIGLNHLSSRGDIEDTPLDTGFYDTDLNLDYSARERDYSWGAGANFGHELYNWYGIDPTAYDEATIAAMDEVQSYYEAGVSGFFAMEDAALERVELKYNRFWDAVESAENRAKFLLRFSFPVQEGNFFVGTRLDYVGGDFANAALENPDNPSGISYGFLQAGLEPSLDMKGDLYTLKLGARLVYGLNTVATDNNFYIYPVIDASYRLADELAIVYAGVDGALEQNSYREFAQENPFVSPVLEIQPTDKQYDAYLGFKGQLLSRVGYNVKGMYSARNRMPLYKLNPENPFRDDEKAYTYGNSFGLFYDDIKTLSVFAELTMNVNRNFSFGANVQVNDYDTETGNPAWNLPELEGSLFLDYQIGERWFLNSNLFYIGQREDLQSRVVIGVAPEDYPAGVLQLDSYLDLNAELGYRFSDQLSVFVRGHNLVNNQYQKWANFRVQGFQVLGGLTYKFDL